MSGLCQYCTYSTEGEYRCDSTESYMCGSCQKLLELDQKIKETGTLKNERQILKEVADHYHDQSFIHGLPPEIIADIFELCIAEDFIVSTPPIRPRCHMTGAPLILSAVCQRWRAIAHSTPHLWKTLPICVEKSSLHYSSTFPLLVKEWIDRAGELPLSIDLRVSLHNVRSKDLRTINIVATQIIDVLNKYSNRWVKLKYTGLPSLLSHFASDKQDLPQLRTLDLTMFVPERPGFRGALNIHPKRLNILAITKIMLVSINFDLHHLTQLEMGYNSLSDCIEALRRAPNLTSCTFRRPREAGLMPSEFPLPRNPIVRHKVQHLEISEAEDHWGFNIYEGILHHLSCPSLKTLVLESIESDFQGAGMSLVGFLWRSGCSLERLSLIHPKSLSVADVTSLCHGIPTLQHLRTDFPGDTMWNASQRLFTLLEEFSIVNGRKEPRYFPALSSLTLYQDSFSDWATLPNIFGTSTSHSIERHRHALESIVVFIRASDTNPRRFLHRILEIDKESLRKMLWLREVGVKLEVQNMETGRDMIDLAVEQYNGVE